MKKFTMIHRALALILVLISAIILVPTAAFAAEYNPNATENFIIKDGVLTQYLGAGEGLHVVVPNDVKEIGAQSFYAHDGLVTVTLPDSVTKIGYGAFAACRNLTSVNLPDSIVEIDEAAFSDTGLTSITIPRGLTVISKNAFNYTKITSITIPNHVTQIGQWAFGSCDNLTQVTIGTGVQRIDVEAFYACDKLQNINVDPGNKEFKDIDGVLYGTFRVIHDPTTKVVTEYPNSLLTYPIGRSGTYVIPDGTKAIGSQSFALSRGLTGVVIPNTVKVIGANAFAACQGIVTLTIPEGVETIMDFAFLNTKTLNIIIPKSVSKIGQRVLGNSINSTTFYVQANSYAETYCKTNGITYKTGNPLAPNLDTAADWARAGIQSGYDKGFIPTDLQNSYKNIITRAEFCRMAIKFVEYKTGKPIDTVLSDRGLIRNPNAFSDTTDPAILAAYALSITSGTGNGTFTPNGQFSREQAATMIMNTCKVLGMDTTVVNDAGFSDMTSISTWAVDGVNFVRENGIMSGTGNNMFSPKGTYTVQESIVTFDRIK